MEAHNNHPLNTNNASQAKGAVLVLKVFWRLLPGFRQSDQIV